MIKMICWDMDGTVADLYSVLGWLEKLRNFDPSPYEMAKPLWDMVQMSELLEAIRDKGIEVRVITWLSKETSPDYDKEVREAKRKWLDDWGFPYDHFHAVKYGATKADSVRRYLNKGEEAILVDDNARVREGWHLGETVNPTTTDIIQFLKELLEG